MPAYPLPRDTIPIARKIQEELDARGWTRADLREITGWPSHTASKRMSQNEQTNSRIQVGELYQILQAFGLVAPLSGEPTPAELVARRVPRLEPAQLDLLLAFLDTLPLVSGPPRSRGE